jgi:cysteine desulfurase
MKLPVYLDYLSTTPVDEAVLQTMLPFFTQQFGNAASSTHAYGWQAAEAVNIAREQLAQLTGAEKEELIFTSGATESCNLALRGVAEAYASKGNHIITFATEHKAVLDTCAALSKKGIEVTILPVNQHGEPDLELLQQMIRPTTILIAMMYANNETGVVLPVKKVGNIAKKQQVLFFCDAAQAAGKLPIDVQRDGIDLMSFSAHKMYGPKGCGALYVRRKQPRVILKEQISGGGHERQLRSGTLNVPGIAGFGKAAAVAGKYMPAETARLQQMRDDFEQAVCEATGASINGQKANRLPHVSNLCFHVPNGTSLLTALNRVMAVSSGSACTSAQPQPSHVLKAMGLTDEQIKNSIRFSFGRMTTMEELKFVTEQTNRVVQEQMNGK